jgi:hypothetical protein
MALTPAQYIALANASLTVIEGALTIVEKIKEMDEGGGELTEDQRAEQRERLDAATARLAAARSRLDTG